MDALQSAYESAVDKCGTEIADAAAEASIDAYNANALAGFPQTTCEAEQLAAFKAALYQLCNIQGWIDAELTKGE